MLCLLEASKNSRAAVTGRPRGAGGWFVLAMRTDLPTAAGLPPPEVPVPVPPSQRKQAQHRQDEIAKLAARRQKEAFAAQYKRQKAAREQRAANKKAYATSSEMARTKAAHDAQLLRDRCFAEANTKFRRDEELRAAAARRARSQGNAGAPRARSRPVDPYQKWRGGSSSDWEQDEENEEAWPGMQAGATEEELELARARQAKAHERDITAQRVLSYSSRTLVDALGLGKGATDTEVESRVRKLLRLLHPDYGINAAIKGTRRHQRIEAAFKRLNGLRGTSVAV